MVLEKGMTIEFDYTNWKGQIDKRKVFVYGVIWGNNEWHKEEQWLLHALDEDKREARYFAMRDMRNVVKVR